MKTLKNSFIIKTILQLLLAIFGFLLLLCIYHIFHYPDYYGSNDNKFTDTYYFEKTFSKYNERVAAYVMYKENGFQSKLDIGEELPATHINETFFMNDSVSDQDKFEFYNQVLNVKDSNFIYYVKNVTTGKEYYSPNLKSVEKSPIAFSRNISKYDAYLVLNTDSTIYNTNVTKWGLLDSRTLLWMSNYVKTKLSYNPENTNNAFYNNNNMDEYIFYTATIHDFPYSDDDFSHAYHSFESMHTNYKKATMYLPVVFILFLVVAIASIHLAGYTKENNNPVSISYDKIYLEIVTCITLGSFFFLITSLFQLINAKFPDRNEFFVRLLGVYIAMYPIFIYNFFSFVRRSKCKTLKATMLTVVLYKKIQQFCRSSFSSKRLATQAILVSTFFMIGVTCTALLLNLPGIPYLGLLLLFVLYLLLTRYLLKKASALNYLIQETKQISDGDLTHKINEENVSEEVWLLAKSINTIGDGFSKAVEEKLKSERFKTELITNVSHDIKTPLTSIINYVDLLKKEDIRNDTAKAYIEVLDSKSQRLKTLIEDLVEASKASSGAIAMHMQKLNLVELIKQSLGEFEDRLEQHNLTVDVGQMNTPLYIYADGRSTYRILDNILSNVYKYAMPGTRVYIDLKVEQEMVIVSVKNISASRLNISADELMERFVRGDLSRSTDGSGLGLSIAQSLAALQDATFKIDLDGDLFKAIVSFPRIY